jgi:ribosome recycling factor
MIRAIVDSANAKMDKAVAHLEEDLKSLRTGRASTALVESIMVDQYGQMTPLKAVATLSTPDAHTIAVTPWDRTTMPSIEKAIRESQSLGLNPSSDGNTIRLNIPPMTEERRKEILKQLGEKVEQANISLRNARHEVLAEAKKLEKDKQATQDDLKFAEAELNKKIDLYKGKIDIIAKAKEQEIMTV